MTQMNQLDELHNHLDLGIKPMDECPGCDQVRVDMIFSKARYRADLNEKALLEGSPSG